MLKLLVGLDSYPARPGRRWATGPALRNLTVTTFCAAITKVCKYLTMPRLLILITPMKATKHSQSEHATVQANISAAASMSVPHPTVDILEQSPALIALLTGRQGTVRFCNARLKQLWGSHNVIGLPMREAWPQLEGQGYFEAIEQVFNSGQPIYGDEHPSFTHHPNDSHIDEAFFNFSYTPYTDAAGQIAGVIIHGVEAPPHSTIDKKIHMRLYESEQRFREMADSAPVLIWMTNTRQQCYYLNKAWLDFTGRTIDQERGHGWMEGIHPDDLARYTDTYDKAIQAHEPFCLEYRLRRFDGNYHWIIDNGVPRFAGDSTFLGYIGTCFDINEVKRGRELKRMNTLLKKQRAQLVALNNAKDEFISIASHQLRTPASAVKQYIGLLQQGYVGELSDMQRKMIKAAYDSNQRQLGIIEALLRVAQVDAGKISPTKRTCDIIQLLEDVIVEQQPKFRQRQQTLTYHHPQASVIASVDQRLLRMVLENIIDNASKYSPEGKTITVAVERDNNAVTMHIKDQGVGMNIQDQKKLFQKFSRLNNPLSALVSGSGLGLYWAKKVIDLHGGTITVESKEGEGSTFIITLPLQ